MKKSNHTLKCGKQARQQLINDAMNRFLITHHLTPQKVIVGIASDNNPQLGNNLNLINHQRVSK